MGRPAKCPFPHVPDGYYAAPIGTFPLDEAEYRRLLSIAAEFATKLQEAVNTERVTQLQARADMITAQNELHNATTTSLEGQLTDARAELKDREERIRKLFDERHADVAKLGQFHERTAKAEHRDAQIVAQSEEKKRAIDLEIVKAKLNNDLMRDGMKFFGDQAGAIVPLLLPGAPGASGATTRARRVVETTITDANGTPAKVLQEEPPPLCFALAQLMWHVRDPELVGALAMALSRLALLPALQGLGLALSREAPDAFAVVAALVKAEAAKAQATPITSAEGTAPSASSTTTNGTAANGADN